MYSFFVIKIKQKEKKNNADTLYEVVCLESESERERRKTTASPSVRLPQSGSQSSMIPSPPEDDEEEGQCREAGLCIRRAVHTAATLSLLGGGVLLELSIDKQLGGLGNRRGRHAPPLPGSDFCVCFILAPLCTCEGQDNLVAVCTFLLLCGL